MALKKTKIEEREFDMRAITMGLITLSLLLLCSAPSRAQSTCDLSQLRDEHKDAATIKRLENAWTIAYLKADTNFERCLLSADFTEIVRSGEVKFLPDELALAKKNEGKNLPIPDLPEPTVLLHGDVAVAYGSSQFTSPDGKTRKTRYADYYLWEDGSWHAFFAQQTSIEN
jgi:hypothetical protein